MQKKKNKSLKDVGDEWDLISKERQDAIEQGLDISLLSVTAPWILKHIDKEKPKTVLDVGCGTGYLTSLISQKTNICCGIDISKQSIDIAKNKYGNENTDFFVSPIKDFHSDLLFDCCVSNMVFMSDPEIEQSLKNIYANLKNDGLLYIMITHPCFWPTYWGYQNEEWFNYYNETFIEREFSITLKKDLGIITHIHRSLSQYYNIISSAGFTIELIEEPYPTREININYKYSYPRFMFFKCKKM